MSIPWPKLPKKAKELQHRKDGGETLAPAEEAYLAEALRHVERRTHQLRREYMG